MSRALSFGPVLKLSLISLINVIVIIVIIVIIILEALGIPLCWTIRGEMMYQLNIAYFADT
jgi:hypothetical protein